MRVCVYGRAHAHVLTISATKDTFTDFYNTMNTNVTKHLLTLALALAAEPRNLANYPVQSFRNQTFANKTSKNLQCAIKLHKLLNQTPNCG